MKKPGARRRPGRGGRWLALAAVWGVVAAGGPAEEVAAQGTDAAAAAEATKGPGATLYLGGSGRFEVLAEPGDEGRRLARLAEEAWPVWAGSMGLPDRVPVAITVRLTTPERWGFAEPAWRVVDDPGGVVTVWIRGGGARDVTRERRWLIALAEGALVRRAVLLGVAPARRATPHWMVAGAAEEALIEPRPAMLDAWRQAAERAGRGPTMRELLSWAGAQAAADGTGGAEEERRASAYGLWHWLQAEAGRTPAWRRMMDAVLGGTAPGLALVQAYPERFGGASAEELELAWAVGAAGLARARGGPVTEAAESRRWLEQMDRVVVRMAEEGDERALKLGDEWLHRGDVYLATERARRVARLQADLGRVHPFYRNAAGSLGRVFLAQEKGNARVWAAAREEWTADMAGGRELEVASAALLDGVGR